jgi:hypothetical protein
MPNLKRSPLRLLSRLALLAAIACGASACVVDPGYGYGPAYGYGAPAAAVYVSPGPYYDGYYHGGGYHGSYYGHDRHW